MLPKFCMIYSSSLRRYSLFNVKLAALYPGCQSENGQFSRNSFLKKNGDISLYGHKKNDRYLINIKNK